MAGEPVEINPSVGEGFKVMSVEEWAGRWKPNADFPACLRCSSTNTKEHYFTQVCTVVCAHLRVCMCACCPCGEQVGHCATARWPLVSSACSP